MSSTKNAIGRTLKSNECIKNFLLSFNQYKKY
jgi:hypothetical protein